MTTRKLEPEEWAKYFDYTAKHLPSARVKISIEGEELGDQPETEGSSLIGITYDHGDSSLEIATPKLTHRIIKPKELYVREQEGHLSSIEAIDRDGNKQIIEIVPLKALPES